jgi:glucose-6-phosphate 1-epimerase
MISPPDPSPCTPVRTHASDGARLVACAHGGQVLGWTPAGDEGDRLWLSPLARCGPGEAIRGGVPVVFPQFAARGPLPKHGLARDRTWELDTGSDGAAVARIAARLRDDAATRAIWPHAFAVSLMAEAAGPELTLTLQVRNEALPDGAPFTFTAALHAYLTADVAVARLAGLGGLPAEDNAAGGTLVRRLPDPLPARGPVDVAVRETRGPVELDDGLGGRLRLRCVGPDEADRAETVDGPETAEGPGRTDGFDSLVVWNPGPDHGLSDVPPDGSGQFLCVEPARLTPVRLAPQESWRATARLTALVL